MRREEFFARMQQWRRFSIRDGEISSLVNERRELADRERTHWQVHRRRYRRIVTTARELIGRPAIYSAWLAPVIFIGGTIIAGLAFPGYDPVRQTISELAAGDAPTRVFATTFFILTGLCHLVTVSFARGIGPAGRVAFLLGALASIGVAFFPLPSVAGRSATHNAFAIVGFILLAAWPVLGMRLRADFPWLVRPLGSVVGTLILTSCCLLFLVFWLGPPSPEIGLIERLAADAESIWPAIVITALWRRARLSGNRESTPNSRQFPHS